MTENVAIQLAGLRHDAELEFFVIDATAIGGSVYRFHSGTNGLLQAVVWQGQTFQPMPIIATGFARTTQGTLPRPTMTVSNVTNLVGALVITGNGLLGAKVIRKRTLRRYLDAVNFAGGNANADPLAGYVDEVWKIDRVARRNKLIVQFELASAMDVDGVMLPRRQVLADTCTFVYRQDGCGYTGPAVAKADDTPTSNPAEDDCGHCLRSCRLRQWPDGVLNYGGFPGAGSIRRV